uniref:HDC10996 n=1 Tax=Drosophila melanogaster TaxID=7227 RepID=Q6IKZ2_DROME|nr:TPA_inf: HDC10996 [Drosophila melanogaster]
MYVGSQQQLSEMASYKSVEYAPCTCVVRTPCRTHTSTRREVHSHIQWHLGKQALYLSPTLTCLTCVPLIWREIMGRSPLAGQKQKPENQVTTLPASQSALQKRLAALKVCAKAIRCQSQNLEKSQIFGDQSRTWPNQRSRSEKPVQFSARFGVKCSEIAPPPFNTTPFPSSIFSSSFPLQPQDIWERHTLAEFSIALSSSASSHIHGKLLIFWLGPQKNVFRGYSKSIWSESESKPKPKPKPKTKPKLNPPPPPPSNASVFVFAFVTVLDCDYVFRRSSYSHLTNRNIENAMGLV